MADDEHPDYAALARETKERRLTLGLSINAAAKAAGKMSPITWSNVEKARSARDLTYTRIERVLGWAPGSAVAVLAGGSPALVAQDEPVDDAGAVRFPDDPILQHLWDTPDPTLTEQQRMALVQLYLAVKRTADRADVDNQARSKVATLRDAM
ncbi:helix-turn-helix domain-containing protein [Nonomuraea sp. NPDC050790]|uniref:helix-turn-helix domain-containing protein n=1 Tax=Nonomuraea sp. NPDC050790 TaxID=3364371 RepID=UPI00379A11B3